MEKVVYRLSGAKRVNINGNLVPEWMWDLGDFAVEKDAMMALELCKKLHLQGSGVEYYITPKAFSNESDKSKYYYKTLKGFISSDIIAKHTKKIGRKAMNMLLEEIDIKINNKKQQQRIIERMIRDYQYQIKINKNLPVDVEDYKENVKFLEDLRDGKIELK
ncbi:MAG: hypothetical protein ACLRFE_01855 [Clostridia bacterium]